MENDPIRIVGEQRLSDDRAPLKKISYEERRRASSASGRAWPGEMAS
jgi:hypothetical protein